MAITIVFSTAPRDDAQSPAQRAARRGPKLACTVRQACDFVDSLPARRRRHPRWQAARRALHRVRVHPRDAGAHRRAAVAFRGALLAEGWLDRR